MSKVLHEREQQQQLTPGSATPLPSLGQQPVPGIDSPFPGLAPQNRHSVDYGAVTRGWLHYGQTLQDDSGCGDCSSGLVWEPHWRLTASSRVHRRQASPTQLSLTRHDVADRHDIPAPLNTGKTAAPMYLEENTPQPM